MEKDQEFVLMVVRELVDMPDAVKVERKVDEMGVLITLSVDPTDMGKIIGKEGRTAKAIRTLLRVLGAKNNSRVNLKIEEPEGGSYVMKEEGEQPLRQQPAETAPAQYVEPAQSAPTPSYSFETPAQPTEPEHENPTSIL
ncbi:MAG: KH domain-containing protein [Patescibacteria group bacterium]